MSEIVVKNVSKKIKDAVILNDISVSLLHNRISQTEDLLTVRPVIPPS